MDRFEGQWMEHAGLLVRVRLQVLARSGRVWSAAAGDFPADGLAGTGRTLGTAHWAAGLLGGAEVLVPAGWMRAVGEYLRQEHEVTAEVSESERWALELSWIDAHVTSVWMDVCCCSLVSLHLLCSVCGECCSYAREMIL